MIKKIPILLIYSRILIGLIIVALAVWTNDHSRAIIVSLVALGLLTDIFDGIIARQLGISNERLRRLDSSVDQVFWVLVLIAAYILSPKFFRDNFIQIVIILSFEAFTYLLSYWRFGKEVATHAILSKIWTLFLFAFLFQLIATGTSLVLFQICFYLGLISRLEVILILLLIRSWTNDVPSLYHAIQIRNGKPIRRSKWFNG